ncbi:MAG: hypothetical protein DRI57_26670 [Deltaproteobacteria bacterium]|nr:MAG: hypothetical protein DRI57_26670 [Deltaproteobacteria bacterium]
MTFLLLYETNRIFLFRHSVITLLFFTCVIKRNWKFLIRYLGTVQKIISARAKVFRDFSRENSFHKPQMNTDERG